MPQALPQQQLVPNSHNTSVAVVALLAVPPAPFAFATPPVLLVAALLFLHRSSTPPVALPLPPSPASHVDLVHPPLQLLSLRYSPNHSHTLSPQPSLPAKIAPSPRLLTSPPHSKPLLRYSLCPLPPTLPSHSSPHLTPSYFAPAPH